MKKTILIILSIFLLLTAAACSGSTPTAQANNLPNNDELGANYYSKTGNYAYIVNESASTISVYKVDESGALTIKPDATVTTSPNPSDIAFTNSGEYAYIVTNNYITAYSVGETGKLNQINTTTLSATSKNSKIAMTPDNKYLYIAQKDSSNIAIYNINESGILTLVNNYKLPDNQRPSAIKIYANYLYVTTSNGTNNTISSYLIESITGGLTLNNSLATGNNPTGMTSNGGNIYVINQGSNNISSYTIESDGKLGNLNGATDLGSTPSAIMMGNMGNYVYVTSNNNLFSYAIESDGSLTSESSLAINYRAKNIAIDPTNSYAYVTGSDNNVHTYSISDGSIGVDTVNPIIPTGNTASVIKINRPAARECTYVVYNGKPDAKGEPGGIMIDKVNTVTNKLSSEFNAQLPGLSQPTDIAIDPYGDYAYISSNSKENGGVYLAKIDQETCNLRPLNKSGNNYIAAGNSPSSLVLSSDYDALYVTNELDGTISMYNKDTNGNLTPNGTISTGRGPVKIITDNSKCMYVVNHEAGSVSSYSVNLTNKQLSFVSESTIPYGDKPVKPFVYGQQSDQYLFSLDQSRGRDANGDVTAFKIESNCGLNFISSLKVGRDPTDAIIDSRNGIIAVANHGDQTIETIKIVQQPETNLNLTDPIMVSLGVAAIGFGIYNISNGLTWTTHYNMSDIARAPFLATGNDVQTTGEINTINGGLTIDSETQEKGANPRTITTPPNKEYVFAGVSDSPTSPNTVLQAIPIIAEGNSSQAISNVTNPQDLSFSSDGKFMLALMNKSTNIYYQPRPTRAQARLFDVRYNFYGITMTLNEAGWATINGLLEGHGDVVGSYVGQIRSPGFIYIFVLTTQGILLIQINTNGNVVGVQFFNFAMHDFLHFVPVAINPPPLLVFGQQIQPINMQIQNNGVLQMWAMQLVINHELLVINGIQQLPVLPVSPAITSPTFSYWGGSDRCSPYSPTRYVSNTICTTSMYTLANNTIGAYHESEGGSFVRQHTYPLPENYVGVKAITDGHDLLILMNHMNGANIDGTNIWVAHRRERGNSSLVFQPLGQDMSGEQGYNITTDGVDEFMVSKNINYNKYELYKVLFDSNNPLIYNLIFSADAPISGLWTIPRLTNADN